MTNNSKPRQLHLAFLDTVRAYELDAAKKYLPAGARGDESCSLLEVGAGTGVQAQRLTELGYTVSALDVENSSYRNVRCFDIVEYDGINIPLPDRSHDVVFSSHVLEHVIHLDEVLKETYRVLSDEGICVHLIPTPSCRAWTLASHYIWLARRIIQKVLTFKNRATSCEDAPRLPTNAEAWLWTLFPPKHGERGNTVTEVYYYSRRFWCKKFEDNNFDVIHMDSNHLFYTMANALGAGVSLELRCRMARVFGSACHIYVLKKKDAN
ncbi:MAG TPA: class I SAM-dependent methyltransferase [Pseudomonas sabulinigri]|uniref:Methyltransferase type 11 domain-containing protein n=1 Tax=marine sediment metagenome TaxID=412755 RepID=A0A0F9Y5P8_9ZZZZ|nr:class I SAM-dependent methyltransferase [Halopseudomonas sabulinigri]HEC52384.1 class I SAM-dependent methyltransferase [Halopseudomonas sabulinigri]